MIKKITLYTAIAGALTLQAQRVDSLAGFDEQAATRASLAEDFRGPELSVHLNQLKRQYIKQKYQLARFDETVYYTSKVVSAACVNEDFESSSGGAITSSTQINGWTVLAGNNMNGNNLCNLSGCCMSSPSEASLVVAPNGLVDPNIGLVYPIYSVFGSTPSSTAAAAANPQITASMGGNNFIRLNSNVSNYSLEQLTKTYSVTASNDLFCFAFISVLYGGHGCCDAGAMLIRIKDLTTNSVITVASYSAAGMSSACSYTNGVQYYAANSGTPASSSTTIMFNKWHVNYIDLSAFMGHGVQIDVIAGDCTAGGHFGYVYFDSQCASTELLVNGLTKNTSCMSTATVSAPANLNSYMWSGPSGFTASTASFTTSTAGVYTLTIPQNPPYQNLKKTMNLVISPANVTVSATTTLICKGEKSILSGSGLTTYSWSSGAAVSQTTVNPTTTKTYTLTGTNGDGCEGFALITVSVSTCAGVGGLEQEHVRLFPNPSNGEFTLRLSGDISNAELIIVNAIGQKVHTQFVHNGNNTIRLTTSASGVYYYTVVKGNETLEKGKLTITK